jgi:hypothetical protein
MEPKSFLSYLIKTNVLKLEVQWLLLCAKMIVATTDPTIYSPYLSPGLRLDFTPSRAM